MFGSVIAGKLLRQKVATLMDMDGTPADFALLAEWLDAGLIRPVIARVFALADTVQAMALLEGGHVAGKVVVVAGER